MPAPEFWLLGGTGVWARAGSATAANIENAAGGGELVPDLLLDLGCQPWPTDRFA
jgi:hypothetical protein